MSVRHSAAAQSQTLPSFSVAFSNSSLDRLSANTNSLPPIQSQSPPDLSASFHDMQQRADHSTPENGAQYSNGRKRSHPDTAPYHDGPADNRRHSPHLVRVKEEYDELADDPPYPPRPSRSQPAHPEPPHPPPSATNTSQVPTSKKRRVTISGMDANNDGSHADAAPISPVVIGIPSMRDDPGAIEQVRSMLTVKRTQEALIEQRRGSIGGGATSAPSQGSAAHAPASKPPPAARGTVRSPNMNGRAVRLSDPAIHPPSPSPMIVPSQQPIPDNAHPHPNALPPPPISFARRRATNSVTGKKKPADILISPRDVRTQPVIQSAPPQQGGRFSMMALPSLPHVQQSNVARRVVPGNVPPTPTRLSMRGSIAASSANSNQSTLAVPNFVPGGGHSPPVPASVPIATTLVPPTPATLHRPDYTSPRASFLAPFETFYDALRDAKELKNWLGEQLAKSQALQTSLTQSQERMESMVEAAVERKVGGLREEVSWLRRRVEELEQESRSVQSDGFGADMARRKSVANGEVALVSMNASEKGQSFSRGHLPTPTSTAADTYTFPPVDPPARAEKDSESRSAADADSPAPFDISRRQSVSAIRMDPPPPPQPHPSASHGSGDSHAGVKSPPLNLATRRGSVSGTQAAAATRRGSMQQIQRQGADKPPSPPSRQHSPMDAA
ncbi:hypothetical protein BV25DRAFT_1921482 [Artomyces pyxidatus]|uniref:Uncharacterized protein n=1 Tax=Artomyces pyxidatus TaxID=48021 RepID=A0ACB8SIU5_9AGAM|nr:hypothetical protein BV25DRAFT_1921482 [Artomyces pyxidatus]